MDIKKYKLNKLYINMSKIGRPTDDPCERYSVFLPKSISEDLKPRGLESKSKRISQLVQIGIKHEKKVSK